jgi:hypothetical protein
MWSCWIFPIRKAPRPTRYLDNSQVAINCRVGVIVTEDPAFTLRALCAGDTLGIRPPSISLRST